MTVLRRLVCYIRRRHALPDPSGPGWTWDGWPICRVCREELR